MKTWLNDLLNFIFPLYCPVCKMPMQQAGQVMCLGCEIEMPLAGFTGKADNSVAQLFWGRVKVEAASSLFRFEKGSNYQGLIHLLKYKGERRIGIFLGKLLGNELENTAFQKVDYIIPVPLSKKKEKLRGYNQSRVIAEGMREILDIPILENVLERIHHTGSQTRKNRIERWENMRNVFRLKEDHALDENSAVLLVDDVITTGATLEACALELQKINGIRIYIATLAFA